MRDNTEKYKMLQVKKFRCEAELGNSGHLQFFILTLHRPPRVSDDLT
jgi:hypothetical protein